MNTETSPDMLRLQRRKDDLLAAARSAARQLDNVAAALAALGRPPVSCTPRRDQMSTRLADVALNDAFYRARRRHPDEPYHPDVVAYLDEMRRRTIAAGRTSHR